MPETSTPHIVILSTKLEAHQRHKQPWHTVLGIATGLQSYDVRITLVTDANTPPDAASFTVRKIAPLFSGNAPSHELQVTLEELKPDRILVLGNVMSLLRPGRFALGAPVSLMLAHQRFYVRELLRIALPDWAKEWRLLWRPLVHSLMPGWVLRLGLRWSGVAHLITFSEGARARFAEAGLPVASVVVPRIDGGMPVRDPEQPRADEAPIFCYFGPPLALRGVEQVLEAFGVFRSYGVRARLLLMIRVDDAYTKARCAALRERVAAHPFKDDIFLDDSVRSPESLREALNVADIFVLPFKITVSDVPLVVPEAAFSGKPVITLDTPGIRQWSGWFPNILVTRRAIMPHAMERALAQVDVTTIIDREPWKDWGRAVYDLMTDLRNAPPLPSPERGLWCLCGADGVGKTALVRRLSTQLGVAGVPHSYAWSRYRNYLSLPFMALMRWTGHSRKITETQEDGSTETVAGVRNFRGNVTLALSFLALQWVDQALDILVRYRLLRHGSLILGDRCVIDTLADLCVETGLKERILGRYARSLLWLLPAPVRVAIIERDPEAVQADRPEVQHDPYAEQRREVYREIAERFGYPVIRNDGTLGEALAQIWQS